MTSVDEFYFRYYTNRLLREGLITQEEYRAILSMNHLPDTSSEAKVNRPNTGRVAALRQLT